VTFGAPLDGLEVLSARGSTRHWSEQVHETFTLAAVHPGQPSVGAEWHTRGRALTTISGQLMNINAGDGHSTSRVHAPAAFDVIKLEPKWMEGRANEMGVRGPFHFGAPTCSNPAVFSAIARLMDAVATCDSEFVLETACHDLAHAVVTELAETPPPREPRSARPDPRLRRVRDYLAASKDGRPRLDELERDTKLGKSQLCALFKKGYGVTMGQYWNGLRLAAARKLLLGGLPPKYVAVDLGFSDEAHFSRIFRRNNGLPPRQWVSVYRKNSRPS
jgi:AraC-like DNA-binding protein